MDEASETRTRRPRRQTVDAAPASRSTKTAKAAGGDPADASQWPATDLPAVETKQGFVVIEGESMPAAHVASLEVHQGAIGRVTATDVSVSQGALGGARAGTVSVSQGALGGALADTVTVSQGGAGTIIAREAHIEQAVIGRLIAQEVRVERPSAVVFMLAQRVSGDVRVLFDWRAALAFGGALGIVSGLVRRVARRKA
jgi:hypothetical protein